MSDFYFRYLDGCRAFNELNDLPEEGWEWHHTLPQCLFGDQPFGLWLTKEQHALATLLQSLYFNHCCLFGDQLDLLPSAWSQLGREVYSKGASERGRLGGLATFENQTGFFSLPLHLKVEISSKVGKDNVDLGRGIWNPEFSDRKVEWSKKGGEVQGPINQEKLGRKVVATINSERVFFPSVREASKRTGVPSSNISKVCSGKRKTARGIVFAYLD
jgi:hypothetical protein